MRIISVTIENFLSIEQAHIDFDDAGLLLIEGFNYDVDRANGAGKTAILNAVSFGLYERLPRKVTASELLRRGAKKAKVSVKVSVGDRTYLVDRTRPKGVNFYSCTDDTLEEITLTQAEWEKKLRLSYNQFIVTMYCSQASSNTSPRFLLLNDADKKQFLLQLLDLEEFTLCKKKADEKIDSLLSESNYIQGNIDVLQSKIDAFSESLIDETQVQFQLAGLEESHTRANKLLLELSTVPKPDLAKFQQIEENLSTKRAEFVRLKAQREMLLNQWNQLGRRIKPFNAAEACPTCGTALDNTHAKSVHEAEMAKLKQERVSLKEEIDTIDTSLLNESKVSDLAVRLKDKKRQESAAYEKATLDKVELSSKIHSLSTSIETLKSKLSENTVLTEKIATLRRQQLEKREAISSLSSEIELQKTVASIYSPTGAQAYVLDSAVSLFNERIAKYIGILWSNLTYELQSYKETVRGDVTAKFSESIIMDGKPISLGSLSGGELRALSICADMALLELLEQQFGIHLSPIFFDEAFDGLDASGKEFALELITELAQDRQVVVIDHASEMRSSFDKVLRVEKRNGISSVVVETA